MAVNANEGLNEAVERERGRHEASYKLDVAVPRAGASGLARLGVYPWTVWPATRECRFILEALKAPPPVTHLQQTSKLHR